MKLGVYMMGDLGDSWRRELRGGYGQDILHTYIKFSKNNQIFFQKLQNATI